MSILSALQDYLKTFDRMELRPVSEVLTDRPEGEASSYAVAPAGNGKSTQDVTGRWAFQNNYVFFARESAGAEVERAENWDFLESLTQWLEEQDAQQIYPVLPPPYRVEGLEVTNAMLLDLDEDDYGVYQVQIQMTFSKE